MPCSKYFTFPVALFICFFLASPVSSARAQSVAFTFDDGPNLEETPRLAPRARNQAMLDALAKHGVKATLFVTVNFGANQSAGLELARAWGLAGHAIGNHSMSHPDLNSATVSLAQYQQEVLACDQVISTLPGYQRWFRAAAGQSLLLSMARSLGLGKVQGWERLVDDGDFEIEALKAAGL